ncbi:unnamed protein product [Periconia digitata]|uniref:Uncharacterized protein n=1 Tax=Periconia digitata TaxID=1303443 RepID=A0A9W4XPG5_9PLEO|nr:unnamed protein product [Periconia digitata]
MCPDLKRAVDIKEADFLDTCASWVLRDRTHIKNAETSSVVGLVRETIGNIHVMVHALCP